MQATTNASSVVAVRWDVLNGVPLPVDEAE